jgi:predicted  nucleic acid-binding Zn-ribbon protein
MTWICPYCGVENEQDDRIGRCEPACRICDRERLTPEGLESRKEKKVADLEHDLDALNEEAARLRDSIEFHASIIAEHEGPLEELRNELEELRAEAAPIRTALDEWKDQQVFYEKRDRAFIAEQDPHQAKLPFEGVPA